jgi:hypothetical protein
LKKVIEKSRFFEKILATYNAIFIALIPKTNNPTSFEKFRPISLCNCIYKIISKIIARRFKVILSNQISGEQFGFLEGRQIHEVLRIIAQTRTYAQAQCERARSSSRYFRKVFLFCNSL